jgi:hypothetical protein
MLLSDCGVIEACSTRKETVTHGFHSEGVDDTQLMIFFVCH